MTILEYIKLAQYTYRLGIPLLQDTEYDNLVRRYQVENPGEDINLKWEEVSDEEGIELLRRYGVLEEYNSMMNVMREEVFPIESYLTVELTSEEVKSRYNEFKSVPNKSMPIVTEYEQFQKVVEHISTNPEDEEDLILTLKLDGWNVTVYIENGEIMYAHTRGRTSEAQDITSVMKRALKKRNLNLKDIKQGYVVGEVILRDKELQELRMKYKKPFKTTRNSVASFINNKVIEEDLERIDFVAFNGVFEGKKFSYQKEMLDYMSSLGFEVPIHVTCKGNFETAFITFVAMSDRINFMPPSDGVVIQPNNIEHKSDLNQISIFPESYEIGLYALKMLNWGNQILKTTIKEITLTRNTKNIKPSLIVEPVKTRDGRTINTVPISHIGRLVDENIYVGKEISISVVSEKDIQLVYDRNKAELRSKE